MDERERLRRMVDESERVVFFGGAGVSTESGIPDFRSVDGLYSQTWDYPPETILSHSFFMRRPEEFYRFHRAKIICRDARPNAAHRKLAELERAGKLTAVVTQNIDGLHQAAGSKNVLELHGSVLRNYCVSCGRAAPFEAVRDGTGTPRCGCGGIIRPDVVLYEEALDGGVVRRAIEALSGADMVIVGGTSLTVYPAAGLLRHYTGRRLALINRAPTPYDKRADLLIQGSVGEVLGQLTTNRERTG